jgi:hypothetical protein
VRPGGHAARDRPDGGNGGWRGVHEGIAG